MNRTSFVLFAVLLAGCGSDESPAAAAAIGGAGPTSGPASSSSSSSGAATGGAGGGSASGGSATGGSATGGAATGGGSATGGAATGGAATGGAATGGGGSGGGAIPALCAKQFGDAASQIATAVAVDPAGNVVMGGDFTGAMGFVGPQPYVAKLDASCNYVWSRSTASPTLMSIYTIAVGPSGDIVVAAVFKGTIDVGGGPLGNAPNDFHLLLVKLDPGGAHLWSKIFGTGDEYVRVGIDAAGDITLVGLVAGPLDFGGGLLPVGSGFVAKLDGSGAHVYSKGFGGATWEPDIALDAAGNVFIVGSGAGVDLGGGVVLPTDGIYAAKLDPMGNHVWSKGFPTGPAAGQYIAVDPSSSSPILCGNTYSAVDFGGGPLPNLNKNALYVAKLDADGSHVWSHAYPAPSSLSYSRRVASDGAGSALVIGNFEGTLNLGGATFVNGGPFQLPFVAKFDAAGTHVYSYAVDGPPANYLGLLDIAGDAAGNAWMVGNFTGTMTFGSTTLTTGANGDALLVELPP